MSPTAIPDPLPVEAPAEAPAPALEPKIVPKQMPLTYYAAISKEETLEKTDAAAQVPADLLLPDGHPDVSERTMLLLVKVIFESFASIYA